MESNIEGILGVSIPIVAIVLGMGIGGLSLWLDYRKKTTIFELHHKERMAAIEKGIEVPPLPAELFANPKGKRDPLRQGLVWTLIGLAVSIALFLDEKDQWAWGLVPTAIGLANLLYVALKRRQPDAASVQ